MPKWAKILLGIIAVVIVIIAGFLIYRNTAYISKEEARSSLAEEINVEEDDIHFENVDLEMENSQYEIDFYYNNNEYEAKIDAKDGKLIYTDFIKTKDNNTTNDNTATNDTTKEEITIEEAKQIALEYASLKEDDLTLVSEREENDDGVMVYEIEWRDTTYEYDFDISKTGEVLQYDKDRIND